MNTSLFARASFVAVITCASSLVGCAANTDETVADTQEQALAARPACNAANQGQQITENIRGGYQVLQCESGAWELILKCTNGRCIAY